MRRVWLLVALAFSMNAWAGGKPKLTEALKVITDYLGGKMGRNQALNRIEFLGQQDYVSYEMMNMLKRTPDPRARANLLEFIVDLNGHNQDVEQYLVRLLGSGEPAEILLSTRGLGRMKSAQAVKPLLPLVENPSAAQRRETAQALGAIGKPAASAPLLKAAAKESELDVKLAMIVAAGQAGDTKQTAPLEAMLKDTSESTRLAAGRALCLMTSPKCKTFVQQMAASKEPSERLQGVMLFEGSPAKFSGSSLKPMLADTDDKVRARAARILAQGGDKTQIDWLVIESFKSKLENRLIYEDELERLRLTDEDRQNILRKAGLK